MAPVDTMILEVVITQVLEGEEADSKKPTEKGLTFLPTPTPTRWQTRVGGPGDPRARRERRQPFEQLHLLEEEIDCLAQYRVRANAL